MKYIYLLIIALIAFSCGQKTVSYNHFEGFTQGTTFGITYQSADTQAINRAIIKLLDDFDDCLSNYNDSSMLSRVNRGEDMSVNNWFKVCFDASMGVHKASGGIFDPSLRPLITAYGFGGKGKKDFRNLTQEQVDSTLQLVGLSKIQIIDNKLVMPKGMSLDFSAIAQGYSVDLVSQMFDSLGIKNYLVEIGGEIYAKGVNSKGNGWRVGIDSPKEGNFVAGADIEQVVELSDQGLATSGNYRKFFEVDGKKYSHSINPQTGLCSRDSLLSVTIIAKNATLADGYATACMVGGYQWACDFIKSNNLKGYLIYENHKKEMITTKL